MDEAAVALNEGLRPLKVPEYLALADLGVFDNERVELLRGRVIKMAPHTVETGSFVTGAMTSLLVRYFDAHATILPGMPLDASEDSMPEPDFLLIPKRSAPTPHPQRALLLIEVSKTSLKIDRAVKAPLYAEGGSPEYWIVDVDAAQLEVFRSPKDGKWTEHFKLGAHDTIRPVSFPDVVFPLAEFLLELTPSH